MEFREIGSGRMFPPVIPNGLARGYTENRDGNLYELFRVTDTGLVAGGISFIWSDIRGVAIEDDVVQILSKKYPSGGVRFLLHGLELEESNGEITKVLQGYTASYCLLNRITFEQQRFE